MTEIGVPHWVVEQAFNAWCDVADVDEWRVRNSHEALRAALTAALGAWVVHEGSVRTLDLSFAREQGITLTHIFNKGKGAARTRTNIYTLRQEKPDVLP